MTLKEAIKSSLTILKQVMEEKLNATNIEVCYRFGCWSVCLILKDEFEILSGKFWVQIPDFHVVSFCLSKLATVEPGKTFHMYSKEELEDVIKDI